MVPKKLGGHVFMGAADSLEGITNCPTQFPPARRSASSAQ